MKKYILPRKTLIIWQLRALMMGIILFLLTVIARTFISFPLRLLGIIGVADLVLTVLIMALYMPALFKTCKIELLRQGVIVERGVFFKNTHILPFSKLIYTQTYKSPLARLLGLTAVSLKAARSRVFIPEMSEADAYSLITALSEGGEA